MFYRDTAEINARNVLNSVDSSDDAIATANEVVSMLDSLDAVNAADDDYQGAYSQSLNLN